MECNMIMLKIAVGIEAVLILAVLIPGLISFIVKVREKNHVKDSVENIDELILENTRTSLGIDEQPASIILLDNPIKQGIIG